MRSCRLVVERLQRSRLTFKQEMKHAVLIPSSHLAFIQTHETIVVE